MTTHSSRRINAISDILSAKTYLEIGVAQGDTFKGVKVQNKTAVDPYFAFDWQSLRGDMHQFHQMTSDRFFCEHVFDQKFDIIFIDGMHTYEQAFRDFANSLLCAHDHTVWVLDDTVPSDPYSAWPNDTQAMVLRREAGIQDSSWHGDVYKLVFMIADFFPMLSYATVMTDGNPQTIVWKHPRSEFSPLMNNLEDISRLEYMEFKLSSGRMNPCSEAEALSKLLSDKHIVV